MTVIRTFVDIWLNNEDHAFLTHLGERAGTSPEFVLTELLEHFDTNFHDIRVPIYDAPHLMKIRVRAEVLEYAHSGAEQLGLLPETLLRAMAAHVIEEQRFEERELLAR